jgi:hypothetical protein
MSIGGVKYTIFVSSPEVREDDVILLKVTEIAAAKRPRNDSFYNAHENSFWNARNDVPYKANGDA